MAASEGLGILGVHSFHYFVKNPERSATFYTQGFGWYPVAKANDKMVEETGQRSTVYRGGDVQVAVSTPVTDDCRAARYLRHHPDGIGSISFLVEDVEKTWKFLEERDGTFIHPIRETRETGGGRFRHFSITTALGDVAFRFIDTRDWEGFAPGFDTLTGTEAAARETAFHFRKIDHITCNAPTMASFRLWLEHVLGMEQCWEIEFHTNDVKEGAASGTGLRSQVMWDPRSGLKFPINEPLMPFFKEGQINKFVEDNWGAGVQHIALEVDDCIETVRNLRGRDVDFLDTPNVYYDLATDRLAKNQVFVDQIHHNLDDLRELGILIDGSPVNNYLIQIFLKDSATLYTEPGAGPFFYELIERRGDQGFGAGNFRALFEAIERDQESPNP